LFQQFMQLIVSKQLMAFADCDRGLAGRVRSLATNTKLVSNHPVTREWAASRAISATMIPITPIMATRWNSAYAGTKSNGGQHPRQHGETA
jgi:hypothetical protein